MDNKNRTSNSAKNIAFGFASKILSMVINFIGRAIFVRILAAEYLGINGLFNDVLMMLSLADLGFGTAMAYSFYRPLAENNHKKISALITFYRKIYNYIALFVAIIGVAVVPFLDYIVKVETPIPHLRTYYLISLANTVVSYLFVYKSSIITADQKGHEVSKYGMWINVTKLILQTIVLYITHSYLYYISMSIVTTLINNLIISYKANKMYPYIKQKIELELSEKKEIIDNVKSVFIFKAAAVVLTGTDNILISIIVGTVCVGQYANYNMVTANLSSIAFIIFGSLTASLGNLILKEEPKRRYEVFKVMQTVSLWLCGVFVVCLYFLAEDFITLWIGKSYLLNHLTLIAISLDFYLAISLQPIWSFRDATGLYAKIKYLVLIAAVINIICSIILGNMFGVAGIIAATVIAKVSTYFWYEPNILFREFFEQRSSYYYIAHIKNLSVIFGAGVVIKLIMPQFAVDSYNSWMIKAVMCFGIVNTLYLIRYFRSKELEILCAKFKYVLKLP